ncbi:hypothetical protein [Bacillus bombysepticus]
MRHGDGLSKKVKVKKFKKHTEDEWYEREEKKKEKKRLKDQKKFKIDHQ